MNDLYAAWCARAAMIEHTERAREALRRAGGLARDTANKGRIYDAEKRVGYVVDRLRESARVTEPSGVEVKVEVDRPRGVVLMLSMAFVLSGCSYTVAAQLERIQLGVQAVAVAATTAAHADCSRRAMECGRQGIIPAVCAEKDACQAVRQQLVAALIAVGEAVAAANRAVWSLGLEGQK